MSTINEAAVLKFYVDIQGYSDQLTAIEAQAASSLATQKSEVAAAIAQVNLTQSQTISALTLEVNNLKTILTDSITATQTELINRADQLRTELTDVAQQLTQDKAIITQEIQDALDYLKDDASVASALRTPRKIQGVDFDGTQDISLPLFNTQTDGLVPKRVGATSTKYLREDGSWVVPTNTTYALLTTANAEAGTATTANTISAKVLKDAIQYHAPTVTNIAGNAGTATKLQTPRTINGVSFDGTQDILLPASEEYSLPTASASVLGGIKVGSGLAISNSVLSVGTLNQSTTGNAATASKLQTARAIGGILFDGSANINLPGVNTIGNQSTTGNAATASKLATPVQINGVDFDGSQSINIVIPGGDSTSYADTAGKLANPVQIHGVNFDGSVGLDIPNFTATKSGVVPAAGSGTTKYLRSDGTWQVPTNTTYTVFGASPGLVPAKVGSTTTKFLREDGTWEIPTGRQYTEMTATAANTGTATTSQIISPSVLKQAIQTHAPTGGGGMNFAAKLEIELETLFDFVSGTYHTSGNILSVSNQANIASAVIDSNGILCLTFNTPISNPNLIATTKGEVKHVIYEGVDYSYLTSSATGVFNAVVGDNSVYSIFQDAEKGYVTTNTKLYITCNLFLSPDSDPNTYEPLVTYTLYSSFPAKFTLGIIDA